jgi:hypothetical protein
MENENMDMELNFANGIKIVIDDDKLLSWDYYLGDRQRIIVTMKDGSGIINYLFEKNKGIFKKIE